ncbi:uncharacterized protein C8orf76 isoform X1 [Xenopus laevis]|uniref:Uncharacterized protein C8orf76 isoform X1 n=2 Tax=Xenopus laevis TaxID=8355 RepID=A2BD78_XENLA|nr:uncharacterized protein C8orf76 isoform X1 [Xenopus laevis]AAI30041.1 Unknown (protein for MGC:160517) [Xenopus laevis]OCT69846.1 hypothetical protein XELAEV_18036771mg [Xenopus laevis]
MDATMGFCFEDSDFAEPTSRLKGTGEPYVAKQCEPQWFTEEVDSEDSVEIVTALKFRADMAYRLKDFEKALGDYCSCFLLLPPTNTAMRRDVQESQARCLINLGRYTEALEIAESLGNGVFNTDHLTCTLNLQVAILDHLGNLPKVISCLQQLISLHPLNPWIWKRLAEFYTRAHLAASNQATGSVEKNRFEPHLESILLNNPMSVEGKEREKQRDLNMFFRSKEISHCCSQTGRPINKTDVDYCRLSLLELGTKTDLLMFSWASFIRARLLLQLVQPQQASFVLHKNLKAQGEIEEQLKVFRLKDTIESHMAEMMGEDLLPEHIKDEGAADTKSTLALSTFRMPSDSEFKDKWFQKIVSLYSC